jgi:protein TonB
VFSVAAHAAVFVTIATVSLSTQVELPSLRERLAFINPPIVRMADITLPVTPTSVVRSDSNPTQIAVVVPEGRPDIPMAPLVAPDGIGTEPLRTPGGLGLPGGDPDATIAIRNVESAGGYGPGLPVERITPPPPQRTPVRLHSGMKAPVKIAHVDPVYPVLAQRSRMQGVVILEATIDVSGHVQAIKVLRAIQLLDRAATDAVKQWRYEPGELNGVAVPVIMTVTVEFALKH